jgi:hypothetical protein
MCRPGNQEFTMRIFSILTLSLAGLLASACDQVDTAQVEVPEGYESVKLGLERVTRVQWERVESGFRYRIESDGVEIGGGVGDHAYVIHDGPLENLRIAASAFRGEALGEAALVSVEEMERLVLRWDEADFESPFLGLRIDDGQGRTGSTSLGLESSPHVIGSEPGHVKVALFGEAVERQEGRIVPSPFSFERGEIVEYGPFIRLPLP